ncbi:MAG: hypothetical protein NC517_03465 [Firmicutes bacterium]|nr:hypothetical protein [Bacillota bacterium]
MKEENRLYAALLALILVVASIPVFCMYIMDGGMVRQWTALLQELSVNRIALFPEVEYAQENGFFAQALNSKLFLLLPALMYKLNGSMQWTWVLMLFGIQIISLGGAVLLYRYACPGRAGALCGILLYMTLPVRIYLCYDRADISLAVVWMLLPYYLWSILHILDDNKRYRFMLLSIALLAAIGYGNAAVFPVAAGLTLLAALIRLNGFLPVTVLGGLVLSLPGLRHYLKFLFSGENSSLSAAYVSYDSIMPRGYAIGELFSCFIYADGKPGPGAGLLLLLALMAYIRFVNGRSLLEKRDKVCLFAGMFLVVLSLRYFPWDLVQRVHPVFLKMVALFQTPGLFLQLACFLLTIPCGRAMGRLYRENDKPGKVFLMAVLFILCLGTTIYQCNMYIFSRLPMAL